MASGVQVTGKIVPLATANPSFPVTEDTLGQGGWRAVTNIAERDAILASFRKVGMVVVDQETGVAYQLVGGITNSDWQVYSPTVLPLSNTFYVDQGTTTTAPNGSSAAPFPTLAAGVAAANALFSDEGGQVCLIVTAYDYTAEGALATVEGSKFVITGLSGPLDGNPLRLPGFDLGGDCCFQNCYVDGIFVSTTSGATVLLDNASALQVTGNPEGGYYLYVNGLSSTFDPNNINSTIFGPVTECLVCLLNGGTIVASGSQCDIHLLSLRNGSVLTCGTLVNNQNLGILGGSSCTCQTGATGSGTGKIEVRDSNVSLGNLSGYLATSSFRNTRFDNPTFLDFAVSCQMDAASYYSLFAGGGNTNCEIMTLTAGEPSCRVPRGDNNMFVAMSGQGKIVIPMGVLTANRSCQLSSSDSVDKQLIIFDSFAHEDFTFEIHDGVTGLNLYTFTNGSLNPAIWRATIVVLDSDGNSFGLFSVEPIVWAQP